MSTHPVFRRIMLVEKEKISEAKQKLGDDAAQIIADGLGLKNFDPKNLKSTCPFHEEDTASFIWNPKNYSFHCFGCGRNYNLIDLYMDQGLTYLGAAEKLFTLADIPYRFGERGVKKDKAYRYPHPEKNVNRDRVEQYLAARKISSKTLDYADVQQDRDGNIVFHFYDENDVLCLVKYRPAKKILKGETKTWCQKDADTRPILFNMNRIDVSQPLCICEGEIDCLAIIEAGYPNVVSVPLGSQNMKWIEECYDWLEQFEKIIIFADNDPPGITLRKEACARLGIWRTLFVDLPSELEGENGKKIPVKDANEVLYHFGKEKVLDLIYNAQEVPITGVKNLSDVDDFDIEQAPGLYSGLSPVDKIIYKFLFGSIVVVTGLRGAGKSTLINQCFVCEPLHQGHDVFIFSSELGTPVLKSWIDLTMSGPAHVSMKNEFIHVISPDARKKMRAWYDGRIFVYDQTNNSIDEVLDRAIAVTRKFGTKIWILDNLSTLDIGANDQNLYEKQKDLIVRLNKLAITYGVFIVLVVHPRKLQAGQGLDNDAVGGSGSLTNLAQYVMSVKRLSKKEKRGEKDRYGQYKPGKEPILEDVEIEILKNRYTGKIDIARVFFDYKSYRFHSNVQELFKKYGWDKSTTPIPKEYPDEYNPLPDFMKEAHE
jgi:KaiC/GvpD/RAD55 family RecA-like ATPase/5S rRNA maturation endonuclease (ribonuclease M5)